MTARDRWLRLSIALLAGASAAASPFLYYGSLDWRPFEKAGLQYFILLIVPVVAGGLVTVFLAPGRARWWLGAVLGTLVGAVAAALYFGLSDDVPKQLWLQLGLSFGFVALGIMAGSTGGVLGWGASALLRRTAPVVAGHRIEPVHVGAVLLVLVVVVFTVLTAVAGS